MSYPFGRMGRTCRVNFTDELGTQHTAEVTAESLYEAALVGVKAISETWAEQPGMTTPISVSIVSVVHQVTLRQIKTWVERGSGSPKETALPAQRTPARIGVPLSGVTASF